MSAALSIGIGCRRGCEAATLVALVRKALAHARAHAHAEPAGARLFTIDSKRDEPGMSEAARSLGLPLAYLSRDSLAQAAGRALTRSARVDELFGLPSIAETAALAGGGPDATLVVPRITGGGASCAIACASSPLGAAP